MIEGYENEYKELKFEAVISDKQARFVLFLIETFNINCTVVSSSSVHHKVLSKLSYLFQVKIITHEVFICEKINNINHKPALRCTFQTLKQHSLLENHKYISMKSQSRTELMDAIVNL